MFSDKSFNLLPYNGEVYYHGRIFNYEDSQSFYQSLLNSIEWENDQSIIFGKKIMTKRKVAWYASKDFSYTYSKITKTATLWNEDLLAIKKIVEDECGVEFNSCLLNLYHDGTEGMAWHSDGEKDLKKHGAIASLSFGAERKFCFKHKVSKEKVCLDLEEGSLLIMKGETQDHWLHRLPPTKKVSEPRINLTFRVIEDIKL